MKHKAKIYKGKRVVMGDKNLVTKNEIHVTDVCEDLGGCGEDDVLINNQEKNIDITENGLTEIIADTGFTGLSKVTVNTNVSSSGGEGDYPVIGDGKTYLYIKIAAKGRMDVPLYFSQTVANGVVIDWGDGSETQTLSGTGNKNTTHTYAEIGEYTISLDPSSDCVLRLGHRSSSYCVLGHISTRQTVYPNMLQAVEVGKNITSIDKGAFNSCYSLKSIVLPSSITSIGENAFEYCYSLVNIEIPDSVISIGDFAFSGCESLTSVVIPNNITSIGKCAFRDCYSITSLEIPNGNISIGEEVFSGCSSLESVVIPDNTTTLVNREFYYCQSLASVLIPEGVTSIGEYTFYSCKSLASIVIPKSVMSIGYYAFYECYSMAYYDFSQAESIPTLEGTSAFSSIPSDCKIIVPDVLYDEWIGATNWSTYASKIIKKSDWDASQS